MKRKHVVISIVAVVIIAAIFLFLPESRKGDIFANELNDMRLIEYNIGEAAAKQISHMYGIKDIPLAKAYSATYSSSRGTMRIWAVESSDHNAANDAYNSMNAMLGGSTGHEEHEYSGDVGQTDSHTSHSDAGNMNYSKPVKLDLMEFTKPDVYMLQENNTMNYYYFKMNYNTGRVYWIIFDSPNMDYQISIVKEAIMSIK